MTEDEIWAFVTDAHTAVLTTLRRDDMPIALPVWFSCIDRTIYAPTRGRKLQRIAADPRASLLVETGKHWSELKAVHFTGRAEVVDLDADLSRRVRDEAKRKYDQYRTPTEAMPKSTASHYEQSLSGIVRFTPDDRILNWDNAKLTL